ncbi:MAG TPA: WYL domain-containing transcriptional regulator [Spirochaetota bacterium]|nr:WYL domain-containing transcriptional regulator [Spirochaetota bacterium]
MNINRPQHARLLFIDEKIRGGKYPNATTLSDEYEVSSRTITRDIEYIRDSLGAPIAYDTVHKGYYYTESNYFLPAIDIRESDFFAICVTEQAIRQYENTPLYETLSAIFNRLKEHLPESIRVNTTWIDTRFTFMHDSFTTISPDVWEVISRGLRQKNSLRISHRKAGAADDLERTVDPYHIVNFRGEWYLVAYCHLRKAVLRFAVSRVHRARLLNTPYEIPADFNFSSFIGSSFGIMTEEAEHRVRILFQGDQAPYITERRWHSGQEIVQNDDGSVILSFTTNSLFEVKRWVLSWGKSAEVLEPPGLVKQLADEIKEMSAIYSI